MDEKDCYDLIKNSRKLLNKIEEHNSNIVRFKDKEPIVVRNHSEMRDSYINQLRGLWL